MYRQVGCQCFFKASLHPFDGPEKVAGRGTGLRKAIADAVEFGFQVFGGRGGNLEGPQGDAHGSGHADGRSATHGEILDGRDDVFVSFAGKGAFLERQSLLVDHDNRVAFPEDGPDTHHPASIFFSRSLIS